MLPKSFVEKQIRFFRFWLNHQLQDGLHYQNELFRCVQSAEAPERCQLYRLGYQLAQQGADILVTHRHNHYKLWVSLRSQPRVLNALQSRWPAMALTSSELHSQLRGGDNEFYRRQNLFANAPTVMSELVDSTRKVIGR